MVILCLCACLLSRLAPPSMQFIEAPSSQHPLCERASRWRGPFTANWPWQSLIETHFLSPFPSLLPRRQESSPPLLLLPPSFTASDWHGQSMCFLFPPWEVSVTLSLIPLSIVFVSASFSLSLTTFCSKNRMKTFVVLCWAPLSPVCLFLSIITKMKTSVVQLLPLTCFHPYFIRSILQSSILRSFGNGLYRHQHLHHNCKTLRSTLMASCGEGRSARRGPFVHLSTAVVHPHGSWWKLPSYKTSSSYVF